MSKLKRFNDPFLLSLVLLLGLAGGFFVLRNGTEFLKSRSPSWLAGKTDLVDKIEIKNNLQETVLEKKDGGWKVTSENNLPVEPKKIESLLTLLSNLNKAENVSKNEKNHQKYGVDEETATLVKIYQGETTVLEFLVGKAGPNYVQDYIRLPNQEEVYLTNIATKSILAQAKWKNLTITDFYSDQVKQIIFEGDTFENMESEEFKNLVSQFTNLSGEDALNLEIETSVDFDSPLIELSLITEDAKTDIRIIQSSEEYYLKKDGQPVAYLISEGKFDQIKQAAENLLSE